MTDEGYIKFHQLWTKKPLADGTPWEPIEAVRIGLHQQGMVGAYPNGVGYGNISQRYPPGFLITGSATGHLPRLQQQHYAWVKNVDFVENAVSSEGQVAASSESMTHGMIYQLHPDIQGVIHVHHSRLWEKMLDNVPTTNQNVAYGTPEMAKEICRLWHDDFLQTQGVVVMAGHAEGIFTFGRDLSQASLRLQQQIERFL